MLTVNQKCNAFASIIGVFCHANNTPEKVVEVLSRLGVSISIHAVHDAIISLSNEAYHTIREIGQTLTAAYAYDNFDIDIKTSVPTVEKGSESTLQHLTSALLFPLPAGTTKEDLRCSAELWKRSRWNDQLPDDRPNLAPLPNWEHLLQIHPQYHIVDVSSMTSQDRWNAWKFLTDLIESGPEYFRQFRNNLRPPETIERVPLEKTRIVPARAMRVSNSTVSGNLDAIANLLAQGGVGDPTETDDETMVDMTEYVLVTHGDLGTGERITHGQMRRALEDSPYRRYQYVIFVMGLFHLKMACADAIWRIFIKERAAHSEETSVMAHVSVLRPQETGKILTNPGFRRMHQIINHDGKCRRIDCWKSEVRKRNNQHTSLEEFAKSKPTFADLQDLANHLALTYVGTTGRIEKLRSQASSRRDEQYENSLIINHYYLLYEELSYAMNTGDIGRVEALFAQWVCIFKATGEHKYAAEITKHTTNVHFFYPKGLR